MLLFTKLRVCLFALAVVSGCSSGGPDEGLNAARPGNGSGTQPTISLNPTSFTLSVTQGDPNPVHTVGVSNIGNGSLAWSVSTTASWLGLSPLSGKASGNTAIAFTATANLANMAAGTYSGSITVIGDSATNSPLAIPVTLVISPMPTSTATAPTTGSGTTSPPPAVSVGIAWDATGLSAGGYYVHYGIQSPNLPGSCAYAESVFYSLASLANVSTPAAVINGLTSGGTYYFAVSAYDGSLESPCSNEIWRAL